jgi:hypothetical protein
MDRSMNSRRSALLISFVVLAGTLSVLTAAQARPAEAAVVKPRVSLIGDSTMMAMNEADKNVVRNSYDLLWDAESCRRLVQASCRGRFGYVPVSLLPLIRTTHRGALGEVMVVMAGYDDWTIPSAIDDVIAEAKTQGVHQVMFLTYRENVSYIGPFGLSNAATFRRHNTDLRAATARHPMLRLADWNSYSASRPEWFYADGIHLTPAGSAALANFVVAQLANIAPGRCAAAQTGAAVSPPADSGVEFAPTSRLTSTAPIRVLDTRNPSLGGANGMLAGGRSVEVPVSGVVPSDATAVVATITAVDPCRDGYLSVYPGACTDGPPLASTVNYVTGRTTANLAVTALGAGKLCVYSYAPTDVLVDVTGWFGPAGAGFTSIAPRRFLDTRDGAAVANEIVGRRTAGAVTAVTIGGRGAVPSNATALLVNVTAVQPDVDGHVTVFPGPCTSPPPNASVVNVMGGRDMAAAAIVGLGAGGVLCVVTSTAMHALLDVQGWFGPGGLAFRPQTPVRVLDTRTPGAVPATSASPLALDGPALLNVAAVAPSTWGFVRATGCGVATDSSILNTAPREITANAVGALPAGTPATVCLSSSIPVHLVADLSGIFVAS